MASPARTAAVPTAASPAMAPSASPSATPTSPLNESAAFRPIVFCGPSGVGKGTLTSMLFMHFPSFFSKKISHTTRPSRPDEVHGVHYYFVDRETFEADIAENRFIEYALVHKNYYGTSISSVETAMKAGKIVILELDVQGVRSIRNSGALDCLYVYISPPAESALLERLSSRGTETQEVIATRIETAKSEEAALRETPELFDVTLVNNKLDVCYRELTELIAKNYPHTRAAIEEKWATAEKEKHHA